MKATMPNDLTYRASEMKTACMLGLALLLLSVSVNVEHDYRWLGILGIVFFGSAALMFSIYFCSPRQYMLSASPKGIAVQWLYRHYLIPWSDIERFYVGNSGRSMAAVSIAYGVTVQKCPIRSIPAMFDTPVKEIVDALNHYRENILASA